MGIPKLWQRLESILEDKPLSAFKGKRVALDFSILVHTATHAFTLEKSNTALFSNHGRMGEKSKTPEMREKEAELREEEVRPTRNQMKITRDLMLTPPPDTSPLQYISQCTTSVINKVLAIIQEGVQVVLVLDGATPPLKKETTQRRSAVRGDAADFLATTTFDPDAKAPYTVPSAPLPSFDEPEYDDPDIDYDAIDLENPVPDAMHNTSSSMTESGHAEPAPIFKMKEMYQGEEERKRYQALRRTGASYEQVRLGKSRGSGYTPILQVLSANYNCQQNLPFDLFLYTCSSPR